jgi:hypothetical protein
MRAGRETRSLQRYREFVDSKSTGLLECELLESRDAVIFSREILRCASIRAGQITL